jgi:hypothetical protein
MKRRALRLAVASLSAWLAACTSSLNIDEARIAEAPPLPYRIAVLGGAFVPPPARDLPDAVSEAAAEAGTVSARTYEPGVVEPIAFETVLDELRRGRLATQVWGPSLAASTREAIAFGNAQAPFEEARRQALSGGADLLLVLEGVREGPIDFLGVTGQWPVSSVAWLLVGLGIFIPDHRYEARIKLVASLRDAHTGRTLLPNIVLAPGSLDIAVVTRQTFLGLLPSLLIPPPLMASDDATVRAVVREESDRRLLLRLLSRLKDPETVESLEASLPMRLRLTRQGDGRLQVAVLTAQEIGGAEVELRQPSGASGSLPAAVLDAFRAALLADRRVEGDRLSYTAELAGLPDAGQVRVLIQSIAGQVVSATIGLGEGR